jgi:hypothetical protein
VVYLDRVMRELLLRTAILSGSLAAAGCQEHVPALPAAAASSAAPAPVATPAPTEPARLSWEQLDIGIPAESKFEPWMMTTSIKSLEGKTVRITGYMHAGIAVREGIREFILLRNIDCPYGRQGEAHHVVVVQLAADERTSFSPKPLTVEGLFHVRPDDGPDGSTWSLYALDDARVIVAGDAELSPPEPVHSQEVGDTP